MQGKGSQQAMGKHKGRRKKEQEGQRELPLAVHALCTEKSEDEHVASLYKPPRSLYL